MRVSPHRAIFDRPRRHGNPPTGATIGIIPPKTGTGSSTQANQTAAGTGSMVSPVAFAYYWDFSNTANWTGSVATGQLPEVGSLAMKQIDFSNGMGLSTINGLTAAANSGGFNSNRGEWGTDASLPAVSAPYVLAVVYQISSNDGLGHGVIACSPSNVPAASGVTPQISANAPNVSAQATGFGVSTLTASTAPADLSAHAALLVVDGTSSELWIDDVLEASGTLGNCDFNSGKRVAMITSRNADGGGPASGAGQVNTKAGEGGLAVGSHPSTAQIHLWFSSVMTKWGV